MSDRMDGTRSRAMVRVRWAWPVVLLLSALALAGGTDLGRRQADLSSTGHADLDMSAMQDAPTEDDEDA